MITLKRVSGGTILHSKDRAELFTTRPIAYVSNGQSWFDGTYVYPQQRAAVIARRPEHLKPTDRWGC